MSAASVAVHSKPHRHSVAVIVGYCDSQSSESYVTMAYIFCWDSAQILFKKIVVCNRVGYFLSGILVPMNMILVVFHENR
jgi:hypothetical protein